MGATASAEQVQKIREAEKGAIMDEFSGRVGSLVSGIVLRFDGSDVRVDLGRTEGLMTAEERIPNERLNLSQRVTFLVKSIKETPKGKQILLSRSDPMFVQKLFEREVPEMAAGSVTVKAISREAGTRTKMAVFSEQSGVDPVGSCVGQKGVRVQAVTNELGGERVDIIQYTEDAAELVKASLSPAEGASVTLDTEEKIANVKVPEDQLSLAIGKDGQNARLAAKLTGWKIKITGDEVPSEKVEDKEPTEEKVEDQEAPESEESQNKASSSEPENAESSDVETTEAGKEAPQTPDETKVEEVVPEEKTA
jgi:N utilization substance protein A